MLKLNFHHLYYFHVIAEERQIARASRRLRIGQPALSTQLKSFESFLGVQLFSRKRGQALTLTKHGEILYAYSKEIFRLSDEMLAALKGVRPESTIHLRVGALDWLPKREVSQLASIAHKRFKCFISVFEDTASALLESLAAQQIDLVLTNEPAPHSDAKGFRSHRVAALPVIVCGTRKFASLKRGFPKSLESAPFIMPTYHGKSRHSIEDALRKQDVRVDIVGEAQDGELLRLAALSGDAVVPLCPSTIASELKSKELVVIGTLESVYEEIWLVSLPRLLEHPVIDFLTKFEFA